MLVKKIIQLVSVAVIAIVMTGCGGGSGNTAIDKIIAYVVESGTIPTAEDYANAGVNGVTNENVSEINDFITGLTREDVDSKEKLQAIADKFGISFSPIADINVSKLFAGEGSNIRFSAENSYDPDGNIVAYEWSEGNNVLFTISVFDISTLSVGKHTITLKVTDDDGNIGETSINVTVQVTNKVPIANAGPDQNINIQGFAFSKIIAYDIQEAPDSTTVTLNGSGSSDDGKPQPLMYLWEGVSKSVTFNNNRSVQPTFDLSCSDSPQPESITIKLTVSDGESSATDTVKINTNYNNCEVR